MYLYNQFLKDKKKERLDDHVYTGNLYTYIHTHRRACNTLESMERRENQNQDLGGIEQTECLGNFLSAWFSLCIHKKTEIDNNCEFGWIK